MKAMFATLKVITSDRQLLDIDWRLIENSGTLRKIFRKFNYNRKSDAAITFQLPDSAVLNSIFKRIEDKYQIQDSSTTSQSNDFDFEIDADICAKIENVHEIVMQTGKSANEIILILPFLCYATMNYINNWIQHRFDEDIADQKMCGFSITSWEFRTFSILDDKNLIQVIAAAHYLDMKDLLSNVTSILTTRLAKSSQEAIMAVPKFAEMEIKFDGLEEHTIDEVYENTSPEKAAIIKSFKPLENFESFDAKSKFQASQLKWKY